MFLHADTPQDRARAKKAMDAKFAQVSQAAGPSPSGAGVAVGGQASSCGQECGQDASRGQERGQDAHHGQDTATVEGGMDATVAHIDSTVVTLLPGGIPMVRTERGSPLDQNAAWLLQAALGSNLKAETLLEYESSPEPRTKEILAEACRRGMAESVDDLWFVKVKGRQNCFAVAEGRRSQMLAACLSVMLKDLATSGVSKIKVEDFDDAELQEQ